MWMARSYASTYDGSEALPEARRTAYLDEISGARTKASLADFIDHIDYIAKRIGWQHAGIGTDFDHGAGVTGFDSAAEAPIRAADPPVSRKPSVCRLT